MASKDNSSDESPESTSKAEQGEANGTEEQKEGSPKPVHFFHPSLNKVRKEVLILWVRTSTMLPYYSVEAFLADSRVQL